MNILPLSLREGYGDENISGGMRSKVNRVAPSNHNIDNVYSILLPLRSRGDWQNAWKYTTHLNMEAG